MLIALLPSEIARLVLSYLEEECCMQSYKTFLNECKYLAECKKYIANGVYLPNTIHGKTLNEYLAINTSNTYTAPKLTHSTQTDICQFKNISIQTDLGDAQSNKRKFEHNNEEQQNQIENIPPFTSNINDSNSSTPKKQRLLIGKNTPKIPELSISTLERHLEYLTNPVNNVDNDILPNDINDQTGEIATNKQVDMNGVFQNGSNEVRTNDYSDVIVIDQNTEKQQVNRTLNDIKTNVTQKVIYKVPLNSVPKFPNGSIIQKPTIGLGKDSQTCLENFLKASDMAISAISENKVVSSPVKPIITPTTNSNICIRKIAPSLPMGQKILPTVSPSSLLAKTLSEKAVSVGVGAPKVIQPVNLIQENKSVASFKLVPLSNMQTNQTTSPAIQNTNLNEVKSPSSNHVSKKRNYKPRKTIRRFIENMEVQTTSGCTTKTTSKSNEADTEDDKITQFITAAIDENKNERNSEQSMSSQSNSDDTFVSPSDDSDDDDSNLFTIVKSTPTRTLRKRNK